MKKIALLVATAVAALVVVVNAGAPNRPPPDCPPGYTKDAGSTDIAVLCTRTVTNTVTREVPGPERVVEKIVYVDRPVEVIKEVPGPERVVTKWKTRIKKVRVVKWKTKKIYITKWRTRIIKENGCVPGQG